MMLTTAKTTTRSILTRRGMSFGGAFRKAPFSAAAAPPDPGKSSQFMIVINNEDYHAETAVLNKMTELSETSNVNMMTVVGGADTSLVSLMHPKVESLTALDMSPSAVHLLRLKLAVAVSEELTTPQAVGFLMQGNDGRDIIKSLCKNMPDESAEFWLSDDLDKDVYYGVLRSDNDNVFNLKLREYLETSHGISLSEFPNMTASEKTELQRVLESPESASIVYSLLRGAFQDEPWFGGLPEHMQEHLLSVIDVAAKVNLEGIARIFRDTDRGLVPLDYYYTDTLRFGSPKTLPPWLTDIGRNALREKQDSLTTVIGKMEDLEVIEGGPFDVMTLSNCYDFLSAEAASESIKALVDKSLKDNGQVLIRRALGSADEILANAGGAVSEKCCVDLHYHDFTNMFYRNPGAIACAAFSASN